MRDLNYINRAVKGTRNIFVMSLIIPIFMGCGAWALAADAAPYLPLNENYLEIFGLGIIISAIIAIPGSYIFRWNWETKYFGAGLFPFATGSIFGIYPILCIALYSSLPLIIRISVLILQTLLTIRWCNRFAKIYRTIYRDKNLFSYIYVEESTAVYYLQRAEKNVVDKLLKFQQFPSSKFFVVSIFFAFSLIPFYTPVSKTSGLPFIHIFLAIGATPLSLMFLGLSTKVWLVYYFYPMKITKETNKRVYVDISSQPSRSLKSQDLFKKNQ